MTESSRRVRENRAGDKPFYEARGTTSAEIIAEARSSIRTVQTRRPATPLDSRRNLFGRTGVASVEGRPPSAFSIGPGHFQDEGQRPPSGRLTPLDHVTPAPPLTPPSKFRRPVRSSAPSLAEVDPADFEKVKSKPQPPSVGMSPNSRRANLKLKSAVINLGADSGLSVCPTPPKPVKSTSPPTMGRSNSMGHIAPSPPGSAKEPSVRRSHSGPKERSAPDNDGISPRARSGPKERTDARESAYDRVGSGDSSKGRTDPREIATQQYFEENVVPILRSMENCLGSKDVEQICKSCLKLWNVLEEGQLLGKGSGSGASKRRGEILRTVFKFLELEDPRLLLRLARLILAMKVTGNNLINVCKLIFKISRTETNDQLFMEENIIECLINIVHSSEVVSFCEGLVYSVGSLKFLSGNPSIQKELTQSAAVQSLASVLQTVVTEHKKNPKTTKHMGSLLVQVTATLRNLADVSGSREVFLKQNILENMISIVEPFSSDSEFVLNFSRILSKLTLYSECSNAVCAAPGVFKALLKLLTVHEKNQDIVVRVCFILGNLTGKNSNARHDLYFKSKGLERILSVFQYFFNQNMEEMKSDSPDATSKTEDILVKVVRVIANLSIHEKVGIDIAQNDDCLELLCQLLEVKDISQSEELVLNTVATLNNLSFYSCDSNDKESVTRKLQITRLLIKLLMTDNMEAILEASRVFGNFSRSHEIRKVLVECKVDEMMVALLDSGNREIVYTACGVLINIMAEDAHRKVLKEEGGVTKLVDVLRDFGRNDWLLSSLVCQTLWNYSEKITSSKEWFGEQETLDLMELLNEYLDPEFGPDADNENMSPDMEDALHEIWESDFVPVGQHLLKRITSHHSELIPLECPS